MKLLSGNSNKPHRKKISKFLADEDEHRVTGANNIVKNTLKLRLFKLFIRKITQSAIKISEKV